MSAATRHIRAGFIPLLDAAPLIVAREQGFAEVDRSLRLRFVSEEEDVEMSL